LKCECGKELSPHSLKCPSCGRTLHLDADVIGVQIPEPPIGQWQEELKNRPKASEESMAEVMRESELRKKRGKKRRRFKKVKSGYDGARISKPSAIIRFGAFLLLVAVIAGLVDLTNGFANFFYFHYGYLTYGIMIVTCLVSLWGFRNTRIIKRLKFQSSLVYDLGQYYRILTTGLVHADGGHLFFNMISLYSIGVATEYEFNRLFGSNGPRLFVMLYLLALIAADLPRLILRRHDRYGSSVGASGAIVGLLAALVIIDPSILIWGLIPGRYFLLGFVVISYFLAKKGTSRIDHSAHIYGAIFGLIFILVVGRYYGINFLASL
jgi:membrane associated rhomboid family serine protease